MSSLRFGGYLSTLPVAGLLVVLWIGTPVDTSAAVGAVNQAGQGGAHDAAGGVGGASGRAGQAGQAGQAADAKFVVLGEGKYTYRGSEGRFEAELSGPEPPLSGKNTRTVELKGSGQLEGKGDAGKFEVELKGTLFEQPSEDKAAAFVGLEGFAGLWTGEANEFAGSPLGLRVAVGIIPEEAQNLRIGIEAAYSAAPLDNAAIDAQFGGRPRFDSPDRFQIAETGVLGKYYIEPFWGKLQFGFGASLGVAYFDRIRARAERCESNESECVDSFNLNGHLGVYAAVPLELYFGSVSGKGVRLGTRPTLYSARRNSPTFLFPLVVGCEL